MLNEVAATTSSSTGSVVASSNLASDLNTFIELLTTQVTNQDPTKPLDSTQFVEQLATFSALEQQIATNTNLETIISMLQSDTGGAASLLNQRVAAPAIQAEGPIDDVAIIANGASEGALVVRNSAGQVVHRSEPATSWSWDGVLDNGAAAPKDTYTFAIETPDGDVPASVVGTVDRVILTQGSQEVGLGNGVTAAAYTIF